MAARGISVAVSYHTVLNQKKSRSKLGEFGVGDIPASGNGCVADVEQFRNKKVLIAEGGARPVELLVK